MLHHLIEENDLKDDFEEYGLEFETDIRFIEEMIDSVRPTEEWTYKGRDKEKSFLYDVIIIYTMYAHKTNIEYSFKI